jgi:hypothetical protein
VHPARADNEVRARGEGEDDGGEVGVVLCARLGDAFGTRLAGVVFRCGVFVLDEVVVRPGDAGFVGAVEAFDAFAAVQGVSAEKEVEGGGGERTWKSHV